MRDEQAELDAFRRLTNIENDHEALSEAARLSESASSPLVRALAKGQEVVRARKLGRQQLAVVAGAELLERIGEYFGPGVPREPPPSCWSLIRGLDSATDAALDLPEVRFEAIDALIDEHERLLVAFGRKPWSAWMNRARRYYTSGDQERVIELLRSILPHVNYTNGNRELLGCPACVLGSMLWLMGPEIGPELAYETLRPVLEGEQRYANEDPEYFAWLKRSDRVMKCSSIGTCHMRYGRALFYAGRIQEAREHVMRCDPYRGADCFLLPMVVRLEYALAADDRAELETWVAELEPRMLIHEDIDEAFQAALRVAQALERLGGERARIDAALEHARACARRLDGRLSEPRYTKWLARELGSGPGFQDPRSQP